MAFALARSGLLDWLSLHRLSTPASRDPLPEAGFGTTIVDPLDVRAPGLSPAAAILCPGLILEIGRGLHRAD